MKTSEEYEEMVKVAVFNILKALNTFKNEPRQIQEQAFNVIMTRVSHTFGFKNDVLIIDGNSLVQEVKEVQEVQENKEIPESINKEGGISEVL